MSLTGIIWCVRHSMVSSHQQKSTVVTRPHKLIPCVVSFYEQYNSVTASYCPHDTLEVSVNLASVHDLVMLTEWRKMASLDSLHALSTFGNVAELS